MSDWKNRITETVEMKPADLQANPKNWRKHPTHQQKAMQGILDEVGWVAQIIWNKQTGHLIDGHLRVEMALRNKETSVPVNVVDLTPEEEILILSTFDPIGAMAETDKAMLEGLMKAIESENEAINQMIAGIAKEERIDIRGDPVEAPEPQTSKAEELQGVWGTARGQVWQCGAHRVLCGDCTSPEETSRLFGGTVPDAIVTDPPYCSGGFQEAGKKAGSIGTRGTEMIANDQLSTRGYQALIKSALDQSKAGMAHIFTDWRMWVNLFDVVESSGYGVRQMVVWDKGTPGMGRGWRSQHELIMVASRVSMPFDPKKAQGNVIKCNRTGNPNHPTEKPVELIQTILEVADMAREIYDPFLGSGTTLIACEQLGRRCFGCELSPAYVAVILQRFYDMTGKAPVLLEEAEA